MHVRVFVCRFTSRQFRSLNEPWFHFSTNKSLLCATFVFRSKKWHFTCLQLDTTVESDPFSVDRVISICSTVFWVGEKELSIDCILYENQIAPFQLTFHTLSHIIDGDGDITIKITPKCHYRLAYDLFHWLFLFWLQDTVHCMQHT